MPALFRKRARGRMTFAASVRRRMQQLGPYKSLSILLVPLAIVEPIKMTGMAFVGLGHWVGGLCMIIGGYAGGLLFVDRIYRVVKSKIYTIGWCARCAVRLQSALARWRWRHVLNPSPTNAMVVPQIAELEAKLAP